MAIPLLQVVLQLEIVKKGLLLYQELIRSVQEQGGDQTRDASAILAVTLNIYFPQCLLVGAQRSMDDCKLSTPHRASKATMSEPSYKY